MNIFVHEFKMIFRSVIIWSLSIGLAIFFFLSIYPSIGADVDLINEMMQSFPEEFLIAFGMADMDWSSILGFYGFVFAFIQICLAIQASNYGFSLVSVEERDLTADFLLAKPVSRLKIMSNKLFAAVTGLTITNAVVWISSFVFLRVFSDGVPYETKPLLLLMLSNGVLQLLFFSVGMAISLLMKRVRSVTPLSMGLAFGLYLLNAFGGMIGEDTLEILSPYNHFEPNFILKHAAYDLPVAWISVAAIVIAIAGSYVLYARRNIRSAV
ncbi:MAG TPA: ABC transporter permease subunit [Anaerolineae bacterium]|nr:ABC transporter permease subunit [Anaerolineae bacterium]